jgi:murein DD-endopeptidase MepM/ murein hydrolase activator NlpD
MRWTLPLPLVALLFAQPLFAPSAQAASQTERAARAQPRMAKPVATRNDATARPANGASLAAGKAQAGKVQAGKGQAARPAAARTGRHAHGRLAQPAVWRSGGAHPGLGGDGSDAAAFCGGMVMPAVALREVSRGFQRGHAGIDLMAPHGSPARAAAAGTVIYAGWYYAYGNIVDIRHADGVVTRYAHLSAFAPGAEVGNFVQSGQEIGKVGATGRASGAHIHFEVRVAGRAVDPRPYLALASCEPGAGREEILEAFAEPEPRRPARPVRRAGQPARR